MTTMKIKCGFKRFCLLFVSCIVTVDRNISTTYCRSSSGVSVDLFNLLILVPGGGGVLPNMGYIGMCGPKG